MPVTNIPANIPHSLLERLCEAQHLLILSGAGMSAESGIPTFRDAQTGLWARYSPQELATPEAFEQNPSRVWQWYESRREKVRSASPHAGHAALIELESMVPAMTVVTQNVDGLHQQAGTANVIELHGNILRSVCHLTHRPITDTLIKDSGDCPPRSPWHKDGLARPDVVWFGESLPQEAFDAASKAAIVCDVCLSVGTSSLVQPAAGLPLLALSHGAVLIEINPQETPLSCHADFCLRSGAADGLTALTEQLRLSRQPGSQPAQL